MISDNKGIETNLNHKGNKNSQKTGNAYQLFFSLSYSLRKQLKKRKNLLWYTVSEFSP